MFCKLIPNVPPLLQLLYRYKEATLKYEIIIRDGAINCNLFKPQISTLFLISRCDSADIIMYLIKELSLFVVGHILLFSSGYEILF